MFHLANLQSPLGGIELNNKPVWCHSTHPQNDNLCDHFRQEGIQKDLKQFEAINMGEWTKDSWQISQI
jgi:hypothetical protein